MARTAGNHPPQQRIVSRNINRDWSKCNERWCEACVSGLWVGCTVEAEGRMGLLVEEGKLAPCLVGTGAVEEIVEEPGKGQKLIWGSASPSSFLHIPQKLQGSNGEESVELGSQTTNCVLLNPYFSLQSWRPVLGHLTQVNSLEKDLMLGKTEAKRSG